MKSNKTSAEVIDFLIIEYPNKPTSLIAAELKMTVGQVYNLAYRHKINKSKEYIAQYARFKEAPEGSKLTQFKKGGTPWNKGKKGLKIPGTEKTQFKKGQLPHNHKPVGTKNKRSDGYWYIKVDEPKKWMFLHHKIWLDAGNKIPKKMILSFKDGNTDNVKLKNLELKERHLNMVENSIHNYPKPLHEVIYLNQKLNKKIKNYGTKQTS